LRFRRRAIIAVYCILAPHQPMYGNLWGIGESLQRQGVRRRQLTRFNASNLAPRDA